MVKGLEIPSLGISVKGMEYGVSKPIVGELFKLTYVENPGMAFGIDVGGKLFFSIVSLVASFAILLYLYRVRSERLGFRISLAMVLGGAVGNLIDRALYGLLFDGSSLFSGKVVDFFDLDFFDVNILGYHLSRWPVFNIADLSVTLGVLLLLVFYRHAAHEKEPSLVNPVEHAGAGVASKPVGSDPPPDTAC